MERINNYANFTVGGSALHEGQRHYVVEIITYAFSDLGCGPIFDIYKVTLMNENTGLTAVLEFHAG